MISATDIQQWIESSGRRELTELEGGENLRLRYVAFLALHHPSVLQAYLQSEGTGPYETELLMQAALDETVSSGLRGTAEGSKAFDLLAEWIGYDESAYELINQLRP